MKEKAAYERAVVSREEALGMFQENKFKVRHAVQRCAAGCASNDRAVRQLHPGSASKSELSACWP